MQLTVNNRKVMKNNNGIKIKTTQYSTKSPFVVVLFLSFFLSSLYPFLLLIVWKGSCGGFKKLNSLDWHVVKINLTSK